MQKSNIEWTDRTWNPISGCTKVSAGCKNCYADAMFHRFEKKWGKFSDVRFHENKLLEPFPIKKPQKIFVNSMSDLFHEKVPFETIDKIMAVIALNPRHTFQVLTKRPERMYEYFQRITGTGIIADTAVFSFARDDLSITEQSWPFKNLWLGVSVEDQKTANERIPILLETPASIRFISAEPLLGEIDLSFIEPKSGGIIDSLSGEVHNHDGDFVGCCGVIDWVITGGESGKDARKVDPNWIRFLRDQCEGAEISFFFKQWGKYYPNCLLKEDGARNESTMWMDPIGKKNAGAVLDGKEWKEFPEYAHQTL